MNTSASRILFSLLALAVMSLAAFAVGAAHQAAFAATNPAKAISVVMGDLSGCDVPALPRGCQPFPPPSKEEGTPTGSVRINLPITGIAPGVICDDNLYRVDIDLELRPCGADGPVERITNPGFIPRYYVGDGGVGELWLSEDHLVLDDGSCVEGRPLSLDVLVGRIGPRDVTAYVWLTCCSDPLGCPTLEPEASPTAEPAYPTPEPSPDPGKGLGFPGPICP